MNKSSGILWEDLQGRITYLFVKHQNLPILDL